MLKILKLKELPDIGTRGVWAELLGICRQSLINAEHEGRLIPRRHDRRNVWYTKKNVLEFIGLTEEDLKSMDCLEDLPIFPHPTPIQQRWRAHSKV
jgi:hypothetical protein